MLKYCSFLSFLFSVLLFLLSLVFCCPISRFARGCLHTVLCEGDSTKESRLNTALYVRGASPHRTPRVPSGLPPRFAREVGLLLESVVLPSVEAEILSGTTSRMKWLASLTHPLLLQQSWRGMLWRFTSFTRIATRCVRSISNLSFLELGAVAHWGGGLCPLPPVPFGLRSSLRMSPLRSLVPRDLRGSIRSSSLDLRGQGSGDRVPACQLRWQGSASQSRVFLYFQVVLL